MRKISIYLAFALLVLAAPLAVFAGGFGEDSYYVLTDDILQGDLIKAAEIISVKGKVEGDVIVAGNDINIEGVVGGDVIAIGQNINISGEVFGNVRVIGSILSLNGSVERNVSALGNIVTLGPDFNAQRNLYAAGNQLVVEGVIDGQMTVAVENLTLSGQVGGNLNTILSHTGGMKISETAIIGGGIKYEAASEKQLSIIEGAVVTGETSFTEKKIRNDVKKTFGIIQFYAKIVGLLSLAVIGLVLIYMMPKKMLEMSSLMQKKIWLLLGIGLVYLVAMPIIAILLMITIIGAPLGLILMFGYLVSLFIAKIIGAFGFGHWLIEILSQKPYKKNLFWPLIVGLVLVQIIVAIPGVGWILSMAVMLWGLGALLKIKYEMIKTWR